MERSLEFKKMGETHLHMERAMRIADACLLEILESPYRWQRRSFESTGVQKLERRTDCGEMVLHNLAAAVRIKGEIECGLYKSAQALVKYKGSEIPHDPSGNIVWDLQVDGVEIEIGGTRDKYLFVKGHIPGD